MSTEEGLVAPYPGSRESLFARKGGGGKSDFFGTSRLPAHP